MEAEVFTDYWLAITPIEAQKLLINQTVADWPNMKRNDRSKRHRELHSLAYPTAWNKAQEMTGEEMAQFLKGFIGG